MGSLAERVKQVYANRDKPELVQLLHPTTVAALDLSPGEVKALCALLLSEDTRLTSAEDIAFEAGMRRPAFKEAVKSLKVAGLVEVNFIEQTFDLSPAERTLRVETEYELEKQVKRGNLGAWEEDEEPPVTVVLRPLKDRVISLARSANGARGLAKVYSYVYGRAVEGKEWGLLGAIHKALGTDRAALLMLENATQPWEYPLSELLRFAKARERGFKSEEQVEAERSMAALERQAARKHAQRRGE